MRQIRHQIRIWRLLETLKMVLSLQMDTFQTFNDISICLNFVLTVLLHKYKTNQKYIRNEVEDSLVVRQIAIFPTDVVPKQNTYKKKHINLSQFCWYNLLMKNIWQNIQKKMNKSQIRHCAQHSKTVWFIYARFLLFCYFFFTISI